MSTMKKTTLYHQNIFFYALLMLFFNSQAGHAQQKPDAIIGEWLTAAKDGKIQIFKTGNKFFGKVTWGNRPNGKDTQNPDPSLRNQDIIGSIILKDFTFNGKDKWEDGTIYDPNNGKVYSCIIRLKNEKTLEVRGYIGISLLGRTEVWTR
jgi:uncharacterized protein (DUF2147 family)